MPPSFTDALVNRYLAQAAGPGVSTAPVIMGAGKRLFEGFGQDINLQVAKVYSSPYATHVRYTVTK